MFSSYLFHSVQHQKSIMKQYMQSHRLVYCFGFLLINIMKLKFQEQWDFQQWPEMYSLKILEFWMQLKCIQVKLLVFLRLFLFTEMENWIVLSQWSLPHKHLAQILKLRQASSIPFASSIKKMAEIMSSVISRNGYGLLEKPSKESVFPYS